MPKKEFKSDIKEIVKIFKEGKNNNWAKAIIKVSYNDKPVTVDIRNIQFKDDDSIMLGKGITLSDEEADSVVDALLDKGYGTKEEIEKASIKRKQMFEGFSLTNKAPKVVSINKKKKE